MFEMLVVTALLTFRQFDIIEGYSVQSRRSQPHIEACFVD